MNQIIQFHCFSQRLDGDLTPQKVKKNYKFVLDNSQINFFSSYNIPPSKTVFMEQVHGAEVASCDKDCAGHWIPGVDGLVTTEKNLFLCVNAADCVSLFFFEPKNKIVGIAHAGWRGTLGEIGKNVVQRMINKHGGKLENIIVGIGPSICGKCYEADKERYDLFSSLHSPQARMIKNDKHFLDLKQINVKILQDAGIKPRNIEVSPYCTVCHNDLFFSYRKNKESDYGEMVGVIGLI